MSDPRVEKAIDVDVDEVQVERCRDTGGRSDSVALVGGDDVQFTISVEIARDDELGLFGRGVDQWGRELPLCA